MSVYKLAATGTGGVENGIAQLDVQFDGIITAIHGAMTANLTVTLDFANLEVSFISVNSFGTNDTRGSLFTMRQLMAITGAVWAVNNAMHSNVGGLAIAVNAGERLWLHYEATATRIITGDVYVFVEDGQGVPTAQRRR